MWTCKSCVQEELELEELFNSRLTLLEKQKLKTDSELKALKGDDLLKVSPRFFSFVFLKSSLFFLRQLPGCWNYLGVVLINNFFRAELFTMKGQTNDSFSRLMLQLLLKQGMSCYFFRYVFF